MTSVAGSLRPMGLIAPDTYPTATTPSSSLLESRPRGYPTMAWRSGPRWSVSIAAPTAEIAATSDSPRVPRNQANPVAVNRSPMRLCGRLDHATRPQRMNVHPTARSAAAPARLCPERASTSAPRPSTSPAGQSAFRKRDPDPARASGDEGKECTPGEFALWDEAPNRALGQSSPVRRDVAGRHEHDRRAVRFSRQPLGDLEAVDVRELDVEQDHLRVEPAYSGDRRLRVIGFAHYVEAFGLQQGPGERPEPGVVIDDEHGERHRNIVARWGSRGIRAIPRPWRLSSRACKWQHRRRRRQS